MPHVVIYRKKNCLNYFIIFSTKVSKLYTKSFETETFRVCPSSLTLPVRQVSDQYASVTKELPSMCARVFALRAHSGCASNLLILFERVDKTAVELFIVRGTSENGVLTSSKANNRGAGIIARLALFVPSSELSSHQIFHRVASSLFLSLSSHTFFSPSLVSFLYDLARVSITAYFLRAFEKRDGDSLI